MATAVISLASSVVGGLLVLAGHWLTRRSEGRRYWRGLLRDAAAALNRLVTLPHGDAFLPQVSRMGHDIEELWQAYWAARKSGRRHGGALILDTP
jgi:hypothetical protein